MSNIAIILASGTGTRLGEKIPKQFLIINEKTILEHCLINFESHCSIDNIYVVCSAEFEKTVKQICNSYSKFKGTIIGGKTRMESSKNAVLLLSKICNESDILLFHDCARPFLTKEIITNNINSAKKYGACSTAIQETNTVYNCENKSLINVLKRENLYIAQTPQSFNFKIIKKAFENLNKNQQFTDDASIVLTDKDYNGNIHIVTGSADNFKITTKKDFALAKIMLENRNK